MSLDRDSILQRAARAVLVGVIALAGCSAGSTTADAADTGRANDAVSDAVSDGASVDSASDGASDGESDGASDAGADVVAQDRVELDVGCDAASLELPMPMGQCDGRGMTACQSWASANAGGSPNANAVCVTNPSGCARADSCSNAADPSTCRCGASPACAAGSVCMNIGPTAQCRPLTCR